MRIATTRFVALANRTVCPFLPRLTYSGASFPSGDAQRNLRQFPFLLLRAHTRTQTKPRQTAHRPKGRIGEVVSSLRHTAHYQNIKQYSHILLSQAIREQEATRLRSSASLPAAREAWAKNARGPLQERSPLPTLMRETQRPEAIRFDRDAFDQTRLGQIHRAIVGRTNSSRARTL